MGKTNYSRRTWSKNTQSATTSTPRLGNNGCPLCSDMSIPENLNAHVNDGQTCADVHLQLAMLRYDNAMCAVGQEKYQELCCMAKSSGGFKSTLGFMIGAVFAGFFIKKVVSSKKRRIREEMKIYDNKEVPGTVSFSSRSSRNSSRSGTTDLEMPSSCYVNMDKQKPNTKMNSPRSNRGKKGRHPSRSRDRSRVENDNNNHLDRTRPSSRSRGGRNNNRSRDRSMSRSRPRENLETNRSSRDRPMSRSRARSRSQLRDMSEKTHSNRDRPMSRSRARSNSRPRNISETTRSSRDRPMSRSRAQSRSRPRERSDNHSRNRSRTGRSRSRSRARSRPEFQEVDLYHDDVTRLPTQVL